MGTIYGSGPLTVSWNDDWEGEIEMSQEDTRNFFTVARVPRTPVQHGLRPFIGLGIKILISKLVSYSLVDGAEHHVRTINPYLHSLVSFTVLRRDITITEHPSELAPKHDRP